MKILFSGGGTLGPVTPLLAIRDVIDSQHKDVSYIWIATKHGPERVLIEQSDIPCFFISSGKFRRYMSFLNIIDIFRVVIGFFQSFRILWREQPDMCISAGAFISVPVHAAAWLLGIPTWIHSQDVQVGLSSKLMAPWAVHITTALAKNVEDFSAKKTEWLGNPIRKDILNADSVEAKKIFHISDDRPVILAMGGGTGSLKVNQLVVEALDHIKDMTHVIHVSGNERPQELVQRAEKLYDNYHLYPFLSHDMKYAYACADIVITRGGFGSLSEIAALSKTAIVIPKHGHQFVNVSFLQQVEAIVVLDERVSSGLQLAGIIKDLLHDDNKRSRMSARMHEMLPPADDKKILRIIDKLIRM